MNLEQTVSSSSASLPLFSPTEDKPLVKRRERRTIERKVIHPLFAECVKLTEDPFWQQVFDDCSRGKFPRGSGYDIANGIVRIRNSKTPLFCKVYPIAATPSTIDSDTTTNNDAIEKTFHAMQQLFKTHLNMTSDLDRSQQTEHQTQKRRVSNDAITSWADITIKAVRESILRNYIIALTQRHKLTQTEQSQVHQLIKIGFMFGWIDRTHIVFDNETMTITDITTLHFVESTRLFRIDGGNGENKPLVAKQHKDKVLRMDSLWERNKETPRNQYATNVKYDSAAANSDGNKPRGRRTVKNASRVKSKTATTNTNSTTSSRRRKGPATTTNTTSNGNSESARLDEPVETPAMNDEDLDQDNDNEEVDLEFDDDEQQHYADEDDVNDTDDDDDNDDDTVLVDVDEPEDPANNDGDGGGEGEYAPDDDNEDE